MPDYGHPLRFGTFITPGSNPAARTVALAQLSEQLGFDLVTFQDHPYQSEFLDTWTLMSYVAAATERIHISANVLNLGIRQPAIVARSAASLDLLSSGRFELGIGAGAAWDAIHAMGGRRLSLGQGVDAFSEGIDVIRALWAVSEHRPARLNGAYHRLSGAMPGPAPAHDIPLWIGALKPRMLRLVAAKGDGWLPSLPSIGVDGFRDGNRTIDAAAGIAGRDPREIVRMLNIAGAFGPDRGGLLQGPPSAWREDLLPLVLQDGASTFVLVGDDPAMMELFMAEVAPALREAVDAARAASGTMIGAVRRPQVRAKRRNGIAYDTVPASLADVTIEPGDLRYARVKNTYMRGGAPGLVLQPATPPEVAQALTFAREQPVPLGVRSGGHGVSGRSTNDGGIIVDVSGLNGIEVVDAATRRVRIGPGARWGEVARALAPHGWALTSGDYGGVGVGGLATAGGLGWFAREHGLTIDHLRAVELVTAAGELVRATDDENSGLFWAMRGAGANFGIATAFEFEVREVAGVGFAELALDVSAAAGGLAGFLESWGEAIESAPRDLTAAVILGPHNVARASAVVNSPDEDVVIDRLQRLAKLAPLVGQQVRLVPYAATLADLHMNDGRGEPIVHTGLVPHLDTSFARDAAAFLASGATHFFHLRSVGGAVADVPSNATAYANRAANFSVAAINTSREAIDPEWARLKPHFDGAYPSFETDVTPEALIRAFPEPTLTRLRELKRKWDPDNVFQDNFALL